MPKFRYYRVSLFDGAFSGTNNKELAEEVAGSEDDFVVDTETNEWLMSDGTRRQVEEFFPYIPPEQQEISGAAEDAEKDS